MAHCALCNKKVQSGSGPFFQVPSDLERRSYWNLVCRREFKTRDLICAEHFTSTDYVLGSKRATLMPKAVPICPPLTNTSNDMSKVVPICPPSLDTYESILPGQENVYDHELAGQTQTKCRTCFDTTDNTFYSLTGKLVKDNERKTLAGFLWDIAKMDNTSEITKQLPQQICGNCLRKLKVSFSFVTQVQKVNRDMLAALGINFGNIDATPTDMDEDCYLDGDTDQTRNIQECFVDCSNPIPHDNDDPIAISRIKNQKPQCKSQCDQKCPNDPTPCKNDCHAEMKSMLNKMVILQYEIRARMKLNDLETSHKKLEQKKAIAPKPSNNQVTSLPLSSETLMDINSVQTWFPISSLDQAIKIEERIKNGGCTEEVVNYLKGLVNFRGAGVEDVLRYIFDDDLSQHFNLEGRSGKMSLLTYEGILACVRDVFPHLKTDEFLKLSRRYILLCHNRNKQKKRKLQTQNIIVEQNYNGDEDSISSENISVKQGDEIGPQMFYEALSEGSITFDHQNNGETKTEVDITSYNECVEEALQDVSDISFNSIDADDISNMIHDIPESTNQKLPVITEVSHNLPTERENNNQSARGKKKTLPKLSTLFPLETNDEVQQVENWLKDPEYAGKITEHIKRVRLYRGEVEQVLRYLFSDSLITDYNYDGRAGRHSLQRLNLVSTYVYSVFSDISRIEFLRFIRQYVQRSHNRCKNKQFRSKQGI